MALAQQTAALLAGVLIAFAFTGVARGASDPACTVHVAAMESIQAKIDAAAPGDTICVDAGTYYENLHIAKDGITLKGAGPGLTVLEAPAKARPFCLDLFFPPVDYEDNGVNGICVADVDSEGNILRTVNDVRVTGFTVHGFQGVGIVFAGTNRPRADHNVAANNSGYGITAFGSTNGLYEYNVSFGSHDAGFYVGDSPHANFTVQNNTAFADLWGILIRDSIGGHIQDNELYGNCAGLVFLNTGTIEGVRNWHASHNISRGNDNYCASKDTGLPFSLTGTGILIAGGDHIVLRDNRVRQNQPGGNPDIIDDVPLAGGIVVVSTAGIDVFGKEYYGSVAAHNLIVNNTVLGNQPFDLVDDRQGSGNRFVSSTCETSSPHGLCDEDRDRRSEQQDH